MPRRSFNRSASSSSSSQQPHSSQQTSPYSRGRGRSRGGRRSATNTNSTQHYQEREPSASSSKAASSLNRDLVPSSSSSSFSPSVTSLSGNEEQPLTLKEPTNGASLKPPRRPGFGKQGAECRVRANHFEVSLSRELVFYHYNASITPEVFRKEDNAAIIRQLIDLYGELHLGNRTIVYDGGSSLYSVEPLPFESKEFQIKYSNGDPRKVREFNVAVKRVQFIDGKKMDKQENFIQALDVFMRKSPSEKFKMIARSFFSPDLGDMSKLGNGLVCWRGFYQSVRRTQMGLSLNIDISATPFYESTSVIEFVAKFLNLRDLSAPLCDSDIKKLKVVLKGIKVEDTHTNDACRQYQISGLTSQPTNQLMFSMGGDKENMMFVCQYFEQKYNRTLQYANWPCLQSGTSGKPTYIPMEVCKIVEGQRYTRKLNEQQVASLLKATCQDPSEREEDIKQIVKDKNNYNEDKYAKELGLLVDVQPTLVNARVLQSPTIMYHPSGRENQFCPQLGQWNMKGKKVQSGGKVDYWTCLNLSTLTTQAVGNFCDQLRSVCLDIGIMFAKDPLIRIRHSQPERINEDLREISKRSTAILQQSETDRKQLQLLIVILNDRIDCYDSIKRICETELDIMSQCCKPRNLLRLNKQFLANLALKINVKVGGRNNVLADAANKLLPLVTEVPTIIFGAGVTHPQAGEDSGTSIVAVVALMDWPEMTRYRALTSSQTHRKEIIEDLFRDTQDPHMPSGGLISDLLRAFIESTKEKPQRIIFYRAGVGEGQYNEVLRKEVDAIYKACASIEDGYRPSVTFIVVKKRHHTRLFPVNHHDPWGTYRSGNVKPGTVVDSRICHPTEFDFYLCSHAGIQGTSRPRQYHVLWDDNNFTADQLQTFTNSLCYTYAQCTRSVSVVPPALYAHKAAFRARCYPNNAPNVGSISRHNTRENAQVLPLPVVKRHVQNEMYFC